MSHCPSEILVIKAAGTRSGELVAQATQCGWPILEMSTIGQALREFRRHRPRAAILSVERVELQVQTELISALRRYRPEVALIAVGCDDDPEVERAVRVAGVACYLTLARDAGPLHGALDSMAPESGAPEHSGLPPPDGPAPPPRRRIAQPGPRISRLR